MSKCIICSTFKQATYGFKKGEAIYCAPHGKKNGAWDVVHKTCIEDGCTSRARKGEHCSTHSVNRIISEILTHMVNEINGSTKTYKHCQHNDCMGKKIAATYGYEKNRPMYCAPHYHTHPHKAIMFDVNHTVCIVCLELGKRVRTNSEDHKFCTEHRGDQKCEAKKCEVCKVITATYGFEMSTHCSTCSLEGMVCIHKQKCQECDTTATYGYPEIGKKILCGPHAKAHPDSDKLVPIGRRQCMDPDCETIPSFRYKDESKPVICAKHRDAHPDKDKFVSINKMCVACGEKQPTFGIDELTHCVECKLPGMVDQRHNVCQEEGCVKRPTFRIGKGPSTHCKEHGTPLGMTTTNPICVNCNETHANRRYGNHCSACFFELNPEEERTINFKTKELAYINPIKELYPDLIQDRVIKGGVSRRRPDGLLELPTHVIVIEIDEGQHTCYDDIHEDSRLQEIYDDLKGRKMKVIRLNPDGYSIDGKSKKSSFTKPKGSTKVQKVNAEFNRRYKVLIDQFEKAVATVPTEEIEIVKLFYTTKKT